MLQLPIIQPQTNFNQFSVLNFVGQFFNLSPNLIWAVAGLLGVFFAGVSFILSYHWNKFGIEILVMAKAKLLYYSVSALFIATMVISLAVYLNSI